MGRSDHRCFASSSVSPPKAQGPSLKLDEDVKVTIDDFAKLDLRVVKIVEASPVEGADKLLKLKVDLGEGFVDTRYRVVFSGIKAYYDAPTLVGRKVLYLANLKPRKMKFGVSEGMILAAAHTDKKGTSTSADGVFLASVDQGAEEGMKVT